jgi:hypothetical protein
LRRDGTELWQTPIDARANAVYDFSPAVRNAARAAVVTPTPAAIGAASSDVAAPPALPLPDNITTGSAVEPAAMPTTGSDQ